MGGASARLSGRGPRLLTRPFFCHGGNTLKAVRSGKWKLHRNQRKGTHRYDLDADAGEGTNLLEAEQEPEVARRLLGDLKKFEQEWAQNQRPAAFVENPMLLSK